MMDRSGSSLSLSASALSLQALGGRAERRLRLANRAGGAASVRFAPGQSQPGDATRKTRRSNVNVCHPHQRR